MKYKSNFTKLLLLKVSFSPYNTVVLPLYFLTISGATVSQIGIYVSIGFLVEALLQIPSGFLSDKFGHKRFLILSKTFSLLATLSFVFATSLNMYVLGSILFAISTVCAFGTFSAFLQETYESSNCKQSISQISSQISAKALFYASILFLVASYSSKIDLLIPFVIKIILDFVGLISAFLLKQPTKHLEADKHITLKKLYQGFKDKKFFTIATFSVLPEAFRLAQASFIYAFLLANGVSLFIMGMIPTFTRLSASLVSHRLAKYTKDINMNRIGLFDIALSAIVAIIIVSQVSNILSVVAIVLFSSYFKGRDSFLTSYLVDKVIQDRSIKASLLSSQTMIAVGLTTIMSFFIKDIMESSFQQGFLILGLAQFVMMTGLYIYALKKRYTT